MFGLTLGRSTPVLFLALALLAAGQACAQAPKADAYSYCSTNAAVNLRLDSGFGADWKVFERPAGDYSDGSVEGNSTGNAYPSGGALHLVAHKTNDNVIGNLVAHNTFLSKLANRNRFLRSSLTSKFVSGRVISRQPVRFGCVEFTARLPHGRGYWPALWMRTPYDQPIGGEIDVLEGFGAHPGVFQSTLHHWKNGVEPNMSSRRIINGVDRTYTCSRVVAGIRMPPADTQQAIKKARWSGTDRWHLNDWLFANAETPCEISTVDPTLNFSRDFHRFMIVWTPDRLIWVLDGVPYFETRDDVPQKAMVLVMNLSVGKNDGGPDETTPNWGDLQVKSVRLMKLHQ